MELHPLTSHVKDEVSNVVYGFLLLLLELAVLICSYLSSLLGQEIQSENTKWMASTIFCKYLSFHFFCN